MKMKRVSHDIEKAYRAFDAACDGEHIVHLAEVFEFDGVDVTRHRVDGDHVCDEHCHGILYVIDEDGEVELSKHSDDFGVLDTVGFTRDELAQMNEMDR